jgi:hypothetical protein
MLQSLPEPLGLEKLKLTYQRSHTGASFIFGHFRPFKLMLCKLENSAVSLYGVRYNPTVLAKVQSKAQNL